MTGAKPKVWVHIELDNGVLSYSSNVGTAEAIGVLEAAKFNVIRNAAGGGVGRPPGTNPDPNGPPPEARGGNRMPGLEVSRVA